MPSEPFRIEESELRAIAIALDELSSYISATEGYDAEDDQKLRWTEKKLRGLLDRYAKYEHLTSWAERHGNRVVVADTVRFSYRADTPPSGPAPEGSV